MLNIIPQPQGYTDLGGKIELQKSISVGTVYMPVQDERIKYILEKKFSNSIFNFIIDTNLKGYRLVFSSVSGISDTHTDYTEIQNKQDGYVISAKDNVIKVFSWEIQGLFYGVITLGNIVNNYTMTNEFEIVDWADVEKRCMYYDLRQTFPKFEKLIYYIEEMAEYKANGLIIEYEDKFPFSTYPFLKHKEYAFTEEQIKIINKTARDNFIEIIPLQQSFGHIEYVLKHPQFKKLRETEDELGELCPSNSESFELSKTLITEMIEKHPDSRYVHLGCDEVWSLCKCDKCNLKYSGSHAAAFIDFVNKLIAVVCDMGKKPIIWHDMLNGISDEEMELIDKRAVVMIWLYGGRVVQKQVRDISRRFRAHRIEVFGAPAVRCHDRKDNQNIPNVINRISNINQWVEAIKENDIKFMVSTNWATAFGMGCPYGIFETSLYLMYYSCDKYWNLNSSGDTYLQRFLSVYHGINISEHEELQKRYSVEHYYEIIGSLLSEIKKNKDVAQHIKLMNEYDCALTASFPVSMYIYRFDMFKHEESELVMLKSKTKKYISALEPLRIKMNEDLRLFLPDSMADLYMKSRFFTYDFMIENFYSKNKLI